MNNEEQLMPYVMLPAKDVAEAVQKLRKQVAERAARRPGFQVRMGTEMRKPDPHPATLDALLDAAAWLQRLKVPNPQVGLTLDEAQLLESELPPYN